MMYSTQQIVDKTNGRWTKQQHQNFLLGLQMYGKNWKKIQELIGTRNGSQIRSHAQKFFLKFKKTQPTQFDSDYFELTPKEQQMLNSKSEEEENITKFTEYSYFLGKIVQYSTDKQEFDFWSTLIDTSSQNIQKVNKRKGSFNSIDDEQSVIQNISLPQKKIKI